MSDLVPYGVVLKDDAGKTLKAMSKPGHTDCLAVCPENIAAIELHPLLVVPKQVRPAVFTLWGANRDIYRTPGPLACLLAIYIQGHGLHPDDAEKICLDATRPDIMAENTDARSLKGRIAVDAKNAIQRRKSLDQAQRLRDEESKADRTGTIKLGDIFKEAGSA